MREKDFSKILKKFCCIYTISYVFMPTLKESDIPMVYNHLKNTIPSIGLYNETLFYPSFSFRYRFIYFNAASTLEHNAENCEKILDYCKVTGYCFGKTKVG